MGDGRQAGKGDAPRNVGARFRRNYDRIRWRPKAPMRVLDLAGLLKHLAGGKWKSADGPETGCGAEYWFTGSGARLAYICVDQDLATVEVSSAITHDTSSFSVSLDEEPYSRFVTERLEYTRGLAKRLCGHGAERG